METNEPNIIDVLLKTQSYIIFISGLDISSSLVNPNVNNIVKELENDFKNYCVVLDFMQLGFNDDMSKINDRIKDINNMSNKMVIVKCQNFNTKLLNYSPNIHIHINIKSKALNNEELYRLYSDVIKSNETITKYINIKSETTLQDVVNETFDYIINQISIKVYTK